MVALSLGAGVQSSALLLMACAGELPKPEHAIFADTQWEPAGVYKQLDYLRAHAEAAGIAWHVVSAGDIKAEFRIGDVGGQRKDGTRFVSPPLFIRENGEVSMLQRQCTKDYKIAPVRRKLRELQSDRKEPVELWIGISWDEIQRMKPADKKWVTHRWPLIERRMRREQCLKWLRENGHPEPPKSACIGCPFHSNAVWLDMKRNDPESWASAVEADRAIRDGWGKLTGQVFLHRSCLPLDEAPLEYKGQLDLDLWPNECEGMCGV